MKGIGSRVTKLGEELRHSAGKEAAKAKTNELDDDDYLDIDMVFDLLVAAPLSPLVAASAASPPLPAVVRAPVPAQALPLVPGLVPALPPPLSALLALPPAPPAVPGPFAFHDFDPNDITALVACQSCWSRKIICFAILATTPQLIPLPLVHRGSALPTDRLDVMQMV